MFVIVFCPGPKTEAPLQLSINSYGHAPLLFLCRHGTTAEPFWAEHFVNAEFFTQYNEAHKVVHADTEHLGVLALRKIYEVVHEMEPRPKIEGTLVIVPLAFGTSIAAEHIEAI
jgi:hypothetical protein